MELSKMTVKRVRTHQSMQIGALGATIDADAQHAVLTLRADMGGVLAELTLADGAPRVYLVPFSVISHIEFRTVCEVQVQADGKYPQGEECRSPPSAEAQAASTKFKYKK